MSTLHAYRKRLKVSYEDSVVPNCQRGGIDAALQILNPSVEAKFIFTTELQNGSIEIEDLFASHDCVVVQRNALTAIPSRQ